MKFDGRNYILSTGRVIWANEGVFGLTSDYSLTEGYDGILYEYEHDLDEPDSEFKLTKEEREEIANAMIERWKRWRDGIKE